jgi:hypothetical protein
MSTTLKVLSFNENRLHSLCKVIKSDDPILFYLGKEIHVDLTVNADFGEMPETELVGKTVEVERFLPFELCGIGVRIVEQGIAHDN